jgi:hypothetical protein
MKFKFIKLLMVIFIFRSSPFASLYKNKHFMHIEVRRGVETQALHARLRRCFQLKQFSLAFMCFLFRRKEKSQFGSRNLIQAVTEDAQLKRLQASLEWKWIRAREPAERFLLLRFFFIIVFRAINRCVLSLSHSVLLLFCFVYA